MTTGGQMTFGVMLMTFGVMMMTFGVKMWLSYNGSSQHTKAGYKPRQTESSPTQVNCVTSLVTLSHTCGGATW